MGGRPDKHGCESGGRDWSDALICLSRSVYFSGLLFIFGERISVHVSLESYVRHGGRVGYGVWEL